MARRKLPKLAPSTIALLLGRRGSGKSLAAAAYARSAYESGKPVFYWPEKFLKFGESFDMDDLVKLDEKISGGLIVIDEAHTAMDARRATSFVNYALSHFIVQLRKRKASLILTTQFGENLDRRLQDQVDIHGHCSTLNSGKTVLINWKDTNGQWSRPGAGDRRGIPRKRIRQVIHNASDLFKFYDTFAVAPLADVLGINKESILKSSRPDTTEKDLSIIRQAIAAEVKNGIGAIRPGNFVLTLSADYKLDISAPKLGKYLTELGLPKYNRNVGVMYSLPHTDELDEWLSGRVVVVEG